MRWDTQLPSSHPAKRTMIDLFSGAGGLSLGLIQGGFASLLAVDSDPYACATYELNVGRILRRDLTKLPVGEICEHAEIQPRDFRFSDGAKEKTEGTG
jgi:site-specific DNA-cytosine methylase